MTLVTVTDAAHSYRIPARTIRRWIKQERMTAHVISDRRRMVNPREVEYLLNLQRNTPKGRLPKSPRVR